LKKKSTKKAKAEKNKKTKAWRNRAQKNSTFYISTKLTWLLERGGGYCTVFKVPVLWTMKAIARFKRR
jgi:hypothetical protein